MSWAGETWTVTVDVSCTCNTCSFVVSLLTTTQKLTAGMVGFTKFMQGRENPV